MSADLTESLIALTRDLVLIPSSAERPAERERCFAFVRNHVDRVAGVTAREIRKDGVPTLLALPEGVQHPDVLLCGHLDVIHHPDAQAYVSRVIDGRIVGPGAGDMKAALAVMLEVFHQVHEGSPGASLGLLVTSDEETGGAAGVQHVFEGEGLRCGVAMIPDGGSPNEVTIDEKGLLHLVLRLKGHAAHAARPWLGRNALEELCAASLQVRDELTAGRASEGWHTTCALTVVETPNRSTNRIPSEAVTHLDIRFPPPNTQQAMLAQVRAIVPEDVDVECVIGADPVHLSPDPLYLRVIEDVTGEPVTLIQDHGGSDARFICGYDIPVLMSRPSVGELHTRDEWVQIDTMLDLYRIYSAYLDQILT